MKCRILWTSPAVCCFFSKTLRVFFLLTDKVITTGWIRGLIKKEIKSQKILNLGQLLTGTVSEVFLRAMGLMLPEECVHCVEYSCPFPHFLTLGINILIVPFGDHSVSVGEPSTYCFSSSWQPCKVD